MNEAVRKNVKDVKAKRKQQADDDQQHDEPCQDGRHHRQVQADKQGQDGHHLCVGLARAL